MQTIGALSAPERENNLLPPSVLFGASVRASWESAGAFVSGRAQAPPQPRLFRLDLGPVGLAFAGMSSADDQKFLDAMVASVPPGEHAEHILRHRGLGWAADLVAEARATRSIELKS